MSLVGLAALFLSFAVLLLPFVRQSRDRLLIAVGVIAVHLATTALYYVYSLGNPADARGYYLDYLDMSEWDFSFGTVLTAKLVSWLKTEAGATYLDCFLLFQATGLWGVIILMKIFDEIHADLGVASSKLSYALLFLPGMHFWTSAIGKDAPLFLGVALALWASMDLRRRLAAFAVSLILITLFRPHIALIAAGAVTATEFFERKSAVLTKVSLLVVMAVSLLLLADVVTDTLAVDLSNRGSVAEFIERPSQLDNETAGSTRVLDAPYLFKLLSLLFRPMFIDANGAMAVFASAENLMWLFIIGFILTRPRLTWYYVRKVFFLRFAAIFAMSVTLLLAAVYYNVGLGLRQKTMILPALLALFVTHWAVFAHRTQVRRAAIASKMRKGWGGPGSAEAAGVAGDRAASGPLLTEQGGR